MLYTHVLNFIFTTHTLSTHIPHAYIYTLVLKLFTFSSDIVVDEKELINQQRPLDPRLSQTSTSATCGQSFAVRTLDDLGWSKLRRIEIIKGSCEQLMDERILVPLFQNGSSCENEFCRCKSYERFRIWTRFDTETKCNSEMAYWMNVENVAE